MSNPTSRSLLSNETSTTCQLTSKLAGTVWKLTTKSSSTYLARTRDSKESQRVPKECTFRSGQKFLQRATREGDLTSLRTWITTHTWHLRSNRQACWFTRKQTSIRSTQLIFPKLQARDAQSCSKFCQRSSWKRITVLATWSTSSLIRVTKHAISSSSDIKTLREYSKIRSNSTNWMSLRLKTPPN